VRTCPIDGEPMVSVDATDDYVRYTHADGSWHYGDLEWRRPIAPGQNPREVIDALANEAIRYLKAAEIDPPYDFKYWADEYRARVCFTQTTRDEVT